MRRLNLNKKSRSAQNRESGAGLSAGAIIARAAATVPEGQKNVEPKGCRPAAASAPRGAGPEPVMAPIAPPVRKNRRARRRPLRIIAEQFHGRGRTIARIALLAILFGIPLWVWQSGRLGSAMTVADQSASSAGEKFRSALGLRLEHIYVAGRQRTTRRAISATLGLDRGVSLTGIDIADLRRRLRVLPWISDVAIERRWPNVLFIRVREHKAIARHRSDGAGSKVQLVSGKGTVIAISAEAQHQHLLLVSGPGAAAKTRDLLSYLRTRPELANRIVSARRLGKRRWDLHFDNGAYLMLPERRPDAAWRRFADLNKTHKLLSKGAVGFDMRARFEFIIRTPETGAGTGKGASTAGKGHRG